MLFLTSVYFVLSQLILLFSYSLNIPYIILSNVYFYIVSFMFPFIFNWSQSKASNANQMSHSSFEAQNFFCSFQLFKNGHIHNVVSTLINVMKLDVENNSIVLTLSNVININVKMLIWRFQRGRFPSWHNKRSFNVDLTLSDVATSYHTSSNTGTRLNGFLGIDECC